MRILHCIHSVNPAGGGPINFLLQLTSLRRELDFEMEIVCLDDEKQVKKTNLPCTVHALGPSTPGYGYTSRLVPFLKQHRQDFQAVLVHGIWQYSSFGTWRALRDTSTPYLVYVHGMLDPWFNRQYPFKQLKKMLYWPWAEYRVLKDARAVLFTCEEERMLARQSFAPYHCNEVVVGHGTLPPTGDQLVQRREFLRFRPELRQKRILLFFGRLHEKKGVDLLISAFNKVAANKPEVSLVIVGPCGHEYKRKLDNLINTLAPAVRERIIFLEMLLGDLKWGALRCADAFVLPSHQENFGQSVTEALSCSTPVLISNQVNIWPEVVTGKGGLVEPDDLPGTERLLKRWIEMAPGKREEMRISALTCFKEQFDIHVAAGKLLQLIRSIAVEGSSQRTPQP